MGMKSQINFVIHWKCDYCGKEMNQPITRSEYDLMQDAKIGYEDTPPAGWCTAYFAVSKKMIPDRAFCSYEHRRLYFINLLGEQKNKWSEYID